MALAQPAAHAQDAARFDVFEYRVEGVTLLPVAAVERAVYPFLGEQKTLADVEGARTALEKMYHDAGYLTVVVSIPQQKVQNAEVALAVTEAPVGRLRVVESQYFSLGEIRARVPELAEGNVPQFDEMQDQLATLNRGSDRRVTPVLRPGKEAGTVEVDLKVQDQLPLHGSVELNDRHSEGTTPTHASASIHWDNLWDAQHSLGLTLQGVPEQPSESRVLSVNYNWPQRNGNMLALYAVHSASDVAISEGINTLGAGDIYGLRYIANLPGSSSLFHSATFGVDYKDFNQTVAQLGSGSFNTPITYMPLYAGWDGSFSGKDRESRLGVSFNFHVMGLAGTEQQFADKRFKGRPNYSYLKGSFSHKEMWQEGWSAQVRGNWQFAGQALVSNEQFSIGGVDTVRGYYDSAASGETGMALSLEASSPNLLRGPAASDAPTYVNDVRLLAFVDQGSVTVVDPLFATSRYDLTSYGLGLRASGARGLSITLDWAIAQSQIGKTQQGDSRLHFRLAQEW
ncbi:ShlB/FhaC/HecB family hemolysin secretion/activation protein [Rhodoferax lacus]|uniref:ShlB/FhaC/HecB family hemolysin secretion/activation protein n=1 Tax=Rhodoferax lacus TaxID=2184758 RepID=A0A3E1R8U0_9BURK|nr:ShlB/FhaC/HecB family hemolysin secretion/activation protein [Rhodoferax lacus]RFO95778.1 ShlB/FhaC/HecB family hemolysin secretion/activation protein [Rhodoferax lacus]